MHTRRGHSPLAAKRSDTPDGWIARARNNGSSGCPATSFAALRALYYDLALFGLIPKLVYFNPRIGSDIIAAKTPMVCRGGTGVDTLISGSFAAWNEANGLANSSSGVMGLGGMENDHPLLRNFSDLSIGVYSLADQSTSGNYAMGVFSNGQGWSGLILNTSGFQICDTQARQRLQTDGSLTADGGSTKGLMMGSRSNAQNAVYRNGVLRGATASTAGGVPTGSGTSLPDNRLKLFGAQVTSGGDFVAKGMSPDDAVTLLHILHTFNGALATPRQVTAEGVS